MTSVYDYKEVTDKLGIYPSELGCVMLDFEPITDDVIPAEWEYYSPKQEFWWVKGVVSDRAHLTLKYGLLQKAYELEAEINVLVGDLSLPKAMVVGAMEFRQPNDPYSAIVLKIDENPELIEFTRRLSYLPHIDTFTPWVPHVTMAYVHTEHASAAIELVNSAFYGRILIPRALNLGKDK